MSNLKETILIVEDDPQIRNFISYAVQEQGYQCRTAEKGKEAVQYLVAEPIDLVLLDLGLPDVDGIDVIKKVREWSEIPIIVVSARDQDKEKAMALDIGADDYLTKPFSATELLARIRVALRHLYRQGRQKYQTIYQVGDLRLDAEKHLVFLKEQEVHVTPLEYALLAFLFKNQGKVMTTTAIIREIYGGGYGNDTQALRTLMAGLRRKIEEKPAKPKYILTEIGVGYRLTDTAL